MFRKLKDRVTNKKGFTLVELIVVIVIILVLAAVMVPNVLKYVDKAARSNTKQEAATMLTQVQADVAEKYSNDKTIEDVTLGKVKAVKNMTTFSNYTEKGTQKEAIFDYDDTTGEVTKFTYRDTKHFISWDINTGWTDVGPETKTPASGGNNNTDNNDGNNG